jgi:hypothetical protein
LDGSGRATGEGLEVYRDVESRTDRLATQPWTALTGAEQQRLAALLAPLAASAEAVVPYPNPMGLPRAAKSSGVAPHA